MKRFQQFINQFNLNLTDFWSKAILCLVLSFVLLKFEQSDNYDTRFNIRPQQKVDSKIVLIKITPQDLKKNSKDILLDHLISINEVQEYNDSYFWDQNLWHQLLTKILKANPQKVGVTLYFGSNINQLKLDNLHINIFKNKKIIWATPFADSENNNLPLMAKTDLSNIGYTSFLRDEDGLIRRIEHINFFHTNFARKVLEDENNYPELLSTINFKNKSSYKTLSVRQILNAEFDLNELKNKIILIGTENSISSFAATPVGFMSKLELWATIIDNYLNKQFIKKTSSTSHIGLLIILLIIAVIIIQSFPQNVSIFIFIWFAILWAAFSLWVFDSYFYWLPIAAPLMELFLIWILYTGHQALKIQKAHQQLQQEQKYATELEQLKNNFVSLISHDLKTPIAKIQAVIERLESENKVNSDIKEDFTNLKIYSDELHRYIQSIIKVLRLESREFQLVKESADINEVIENVILKLKPLAHKKNIQLNTKLEPLFLIEFDITLMTEVILNLIENGIKYTPLNGIVFISTYETETEVFIEIQDNGEGINIEDQEHIFKKFVRGKNQDLKSKGSGLGLYLVKYFVELHRGHISFKSTPHIGTTFTIRLPLD